MYDPTGDQPLTPGPAEPDSAPAPDGELAEQVEEARPRRSRRDAPRWENEARDRLRAALRRFGKPLADLHSRDANEGDTRLLVTDFLCEALGYDKYEELTTEYAVKGEFADYGVRIDGELVAFVEVKRVKTKLSQRQLRQVEMYAVNEGVEWAVLTNGSHWQVYHLSDRTPIEVTLALEVDLLGDGTPAQKAEQLYYLARESLARRQIDELWQARKATSPPSLTRVMLSEPVVEAARKELRKQTGHRVDGEELEKMLRDTVIRPECL